MNKPNPELLAKIRDGMARYNEARKVTHNNWNNESKIADEINHKVGSSSHRRSVRYTDRHSSPLSELSYVTIKYDSLNEVLDKIKLADNSTVEDLVAHVEQMRAAPLEAATKQINDKYDSVIDSIRNMKEPKEVTSFVDRFKPDPLHEITYFRWSDLVREFGTEEDKKSLEPCEAATREWLDRHAPALAHWPILFRKDGDDRHDVIAKPEMLDAYVRAHHNINPSAIFEDRNSMVEKWRELGYTVFQPANGDF